MPGKLAQLLVLREMDRGVQRRTRSRATLDTVSFVSQHGSGVKFTADEAPGWKVGGGEGISKAMLSVILPIPFKQ
jgi:hypothetical protein